MLRIAGINIPEDKRLEIGLTAIFGVGRPQAHQILTESKVDFGKKPKDLSATEENAIRKAVEERKIEGDLKREISQNIKRLKDIKSYSGSRHSLGLPVRGQRTKTNARTRKGPKKTMGSGKKKVDKK
ncbi:MAG: 30S ribosomal protein S13 [Candidatus Vogelbacteria bacterium RIFOXYD1_FULL_46_19]|uniref:Small ribosomal subunit protein uS13 n=1 Tax=Candidatus Vogelbacteria bacterium RIFOXYD1_FULL_46_19 TaxID=1802439 RepID=A0A1G2QFR2_9BACT|nr:MAG: 30S ribosomal protein S13 [Candidatus Vogelbacteria bacterium RIFOXYD1_FULL_46_19]